MSSKKAMKQAQKQSYAKHRSNITNSRFHSKKKISLAPWTHETLKYGVSRTRKYIVMVIGGIILFLYQTCTGKLPPIGS